MVFILYLTISTSIDLITMGLFLASIVGLVLISALTVLLQIRYARRRTPWVVHLVVFISWCLAFSMCVMLPADLMNESHIQLEIYWRVAYWVSFFFCWAVIPFIQEYYDSGGFTAGDRIKQSIVSNLWFYAIAGVIMGSLVTWIAIKSGITASELPSFIICISTTFGLFLLTLSLGYGLVELPRTLWYRANRNIRHVSLLFRLGELHANAAEEQDRLQQTHTLAEQIERKFAQSHQLEFHGYAVQIVEKCPKPDCYKFLNITPTRPIEEVKVIDRIKEKKIEDITRDDLIALHTLAINHSRTLRIAQADFSDLVDGLVENELLSAYASSSNQITCDDGVEISTTSTNSSSASRPSRKAHTVTLPPIATHRSAFHRFLFMLRVRYAPTLLRIFAILMAICTATVLWMELTLAIPTTLSPLALLTFAVGDRTGLLYIVMIIPVTFIVLCTFYSIFVLRISSFYHMHAGGRTGSVSILHNASFTLRLMPPLAYNFFLLTNVKDNAFFTIIGKMRVIPVLGDKFHIYFPSVIFLYSVATFFNWFARLKKALGIPHFEYNSKFEHDSVKEGLIIYRREKRRRERENPHDNGGNGTAQYSLFDDSPSNPAKEYL